MLQDTILFQAKVPGKMKIKRKESFSNAAGVLLLLAGLSVPAFLNQKTGIAIILTLVLTATLVIIGNSIGLVRYGANNHILQLTTEGIYFIDQWDNRTLLLQLDGIDYFRYFSISYDEDEPQHTLQAVYRKDKADLSLADLGKKKTEQLLDTLQQLGHKIFMVYEDKERGRNAF